MVKNGLTIYAGKRVLLLQGPVGPFFRRLQVDLAQAGAKVFKVNFNGGDWLFYPHDAFNYRGTPQAWPAYLESLIGQWSVDMLMLFGDCRPIHREALETAQRLGLEVGVFEEGYIRPNFITLEKFGVNGNSRLPRSPDFYWNSRLVSLLSQPNLGNTYWHTVGWAILYYFAAGLLKPVFRAYLHHRSLAWREGLPWLRSVWRKGYYALAEWGVLKILRTRHAGRYFLVPLQVYNDAQISAHSAFATIADFIGEVMSSFARYAPRNSILVIKHHPMDRGYCDYAALISERARALNLLDRCFYIHDQHLPTLLEHARGVVVINSTVGLSAMTHGTPVKVCGTAIYDMKGLTFHESLNQFWVAAPRAQPNPLLLRRFQDYLIAHSQVGGSFYRRLPIVASATGLSWISRQADMAARGASVKPRHAGQPGSGATILRFPRRAASKTALSLATGDPLLRPPGAYDRDWP